MTLRVGLKSVVLGGPGLYLAKTSGGVGPAPTFVSVYQTSGPWRAAAIGANVTNAVAGASLKMEMSVDSGATWTNCTSTTLVDSTHVTFATPQWSQDYANTLVRFRFTNGDGQQVTSGSGVYAVLLDPDDIPTSGVLFCVDAGTGVTSTSVTDRIKSVVFSGTATAVASDITNHQPYLLGDGTTARQLTHTFGAAPTSAKAHRWLVAHYDASGSYGAYNNGGGYGTADCWEPFSDLNFYEWFGSNVRQGPTAVGITAPSNFCEHVSNDGSGTWKLTFNGVTKATVTGVTIGWGTLFELLGNGSLAGTPLPANNAIFFDLVCTDLGANEANLVAGINAYITRRFGTAAS